MAHMPAIYAFRLFVVVAVGTGLVPLLFPMRFFGYLIVAFPQLRILFLILHPLTLTSS